MRYERYRSALTAADKKEADAIFAKLVEDNIASSGNVRGRKEAEAIVRRNIAHIAASSDDKTRNRVSKLFRTAKMPVSKPEKSSLKEALPRPGPRVTTISDREDLSLSMEELSRLLDDPDVKLKFVVEKSPEPPAALKRGEHPRRDRWRPWVVAQGTMPENHIGWKPMGWIEV
jgi:hypothetical protein